MVSSIEVFYSCGHSGVEKNINIDNTPEMIARYKLAASEKKCPLCSKQHYILGRNII